MALPGLFQLFFRGYFQVYFNLLPLLNLTIFLYIQYFSNALLPCLASFKQILLDQKNLFLRRESTLGQPKGKRNRGQGGGSGPGGLQEKLSSPVPTLCSGLP